MNFKIVIVCALSFLIINGFAQQKTDVVYLKNGSIIKGVIIEKTTEKVKIESCCGNIFAFDSIQIEKLETIDKPLPGYFKNNGYYNYTSMGVLVGSDKDDKQAVFSVLMEHNYQFNTYLAVGGYLGIEFFNQAVAPIGLNIKGILPLAGKSAFYANLSGGYSIPLEDAKSDNYYEYTDTKGGVTYTSEIGFIVPSNSNVNLFIAMGYRYNEMNYVRTDWYYGDVDRKITYNRFVLKLGIAFH